MTNTKKDTHSITKHGKYFKNWKRVTTLCKKITMLVFVAIYLIDVFSDRYGSYPSNTNWYWCHEKYNKKIWNPIWKVENIWSNYKSITTLYVIITLLIFVKYTLSMYFISIRCKTNNDVVINTKKQYGLQHEKWEISGNTYKCITTLCITITMLLFSPRFDQRCISVWVRTFIGAALLIFHFPMLNNIWFVSWGYFANGLYCIKYVANNIRFMPYLY